MLGSHHCYLWSWVITLPLFGQGAATASQILKLSSQRRVPQRRPLIRQTFIGANASHASEPLLDYFNGTDLQWYGNASFGTPPQTLTVVFDTGSSDAEIPAIGCKTCSNQRSFDPKSSSTFVDMNNSTVLQFATGVGVDPSDFENLTVSAVRDTFTILNYSAPATDFFIITNQSSGFAADPFDGIVGMSYYPNHSVYSVLNQNNQPSLFGLYLTPKSIGDAELTLGGIDETKFTGDVIYSPIVEPHTIPNFWALNLSLITVNGHTSPVLTTRQQLIFDSGTSNCVFSASITEAIYSLISPNIKPHGTLGAFGMPCSQINHTNVELNFTLSDSSGQSFNLTIPSSEFNLGPFRDDPATCQTIINALDGYNILGGSLMKHYYTVWDVDHARMGFAPVKQAKSNCESVLDPKNSLLIFSWLFFCVWACIGLAPL